MRRIYLLLTVVLCAICGYVGYRLGSAFIQDDADVSAIHAKLDSLERELKYSQKRADQYQYAFIKDGIKIIDLQENMRQREAAHVKERKYYEKRIQEISTYSVTELDSFFIARYPRPGLVAPDTGLARPINRPGSDTLRLNSERVPQDSIGPFGYSGDSINQVEYDQHAEQGYFRERPSDINTRAEGQHSVKIGRRSQEIQTPAESFDRWRYTHNRSGCYDFKLVKTAYHLHRHRPIHVKDLQQDALDLAYCQTLSVMSHLFLPAAPLLFR
jgi:hypothetical protein